MLRAAWVHFRLGALVLAAAFSWVFNLIVFASFGINWQLIFGEDSAGAAAVSAATIARVCGAATLWLCFLVDRRVYPAFRLQAWLTMRLVLTTVASASCVFVSGIA